MGRVRRDAAATGRGGYVLVAVVSFTAAAVITALCFRLRIKENRRKDGTDKPNRHEQEEKKPMKKRILSILLVCCMVLTMLPTAAFRRQGSPSRYHNHLYAGITMPTAEAARRQVRA